MKNFISFIKEYATRDFIYFFSQKSIEMYKHQLEQEDNELSASMIFSMNAILHGFIHKQVQVRLSAWDIQDMVYLSIKYANDYRKKIMTEDKAGSVVNLYRGYENEYTGLQYKEKSSGEDIFKFLMGMTYEQFKYQNLSWTYQSFSRNYHILVASNKICRDTIIDVNDITAKLFQLDVGEFLEIELIVWWLCTLSPTPLAIPESAYNKNSSTLLTKENIRKIIDYYSVTYPQVRESIVEKQVFYSKPFVITQKKKETIVANFYLLQMLLGDGLYWLVRDYYQQNNLGQKFINAFGKMFEDYFEELVDEYIPKGAWHKIPEKKGKSADYYIEVEDVIFVFELKSGLLGIGAKQQTPDIKQINNFYNRNIKEAYEQLKASVKEYEGKKQIIKVFLLYENMTNTQIVMSSMPEIFLDDSQYYIMTIEDLEVLLVTYKNNREAFKEIIGALVTNQNTLVHFKTVHNVLSEYNVLENEHFVNERDYFAHILNRLSKELDVEVEEK